LDTQGINLNSGNNLSLMSEEFGFFCFELLKKFYFEVGVGETHIIKPLLYKWTKFFKEFVCVRPYITI